MSIANRILAAQALLARSRRALEAHHADRRTVLLDAVGTAPSKPAAARDEAAQLGVGFQRHGGK